MFICAPCCRTNNTPILKKKAQTKHFCFCQCAEDETLKEQEKLCSVGRVSALELFIDKTVIWPAFKSNGVAGNVTSRTCCRVTWSACVGCPWRWLLARGWGKRAAAFGCSEASNKDKKWLWFGKRDWVFFSVVVSSQCWRHVYGHLSEIQGSHLTLQQSDY